MTEQITTCRICGCTDERACVGGCSWVEVCRQKGEGYCSRCAELVPISVEKTYGVSVATAVACRTVFQSRSVHREESAVRRVAQKAFGRRLLAWFAAGKNYRALVKLEGVK